MLRNRTVLALLVARLISLTGSSMTLVALPWFVLVTTGSPARMGLVLAAQLLPVAVLGIPSGSVLAALGPKRTMVLADLLRVPAMTAVPVLHWLGLLSFPLLLALAFVVGAFRAPYGAAMHVLLPELAGEDEGLVGQAAALFQSVTQGTVIFGPVLAGVLIVATSAPVALLVDAATFLVSGLLVLGFVAAGARVAPDDSSRGVFAGLRHLVRDPLLLPLALAAVAMALANEALVGMLPVLAFDRFGSASAAGTIFAADGIGSLVGTVAALRLTTRLAAPTLMRVAVLVMSAALWPLAIRLPLAGVLAAIFVFGLGSMLMAPPLISIMTLRTPGALRPKVLTAFFTVMTLAGPAGLAAAGPAVQAFGLRTMFLGIAAVFTVGAAAFSIVIAARAAVPPPTAAEPAEPATA